MPALGSFRAGNKSGPARGWMPNTIGRSLGKPTLPFVVSGCAGVPVAVSQNLPGQAFSAGSLRRHPSRNNMPPFGAPVKAPLLP